MRVVVQRVSAAKVTIDGKTVGEIGSGLLVLLAVHEADDEKTIGKMAAKIAALRIFEDAAGKMNLSVADIDGGILVVSQFTLYGDASGGNRPSFTAAARPEKAQPFYDKFVTSLRDLRIKKVETGRFGATMAVELVNDGPVTIIIDL